MDGVDDPFGVVVSWLDAPVVDAEVSAEFQRCFDDVSSFSHVFVHGVSDPEVVFEFFCSLYEVFEFKWVLFVVEDAEFVSLEEEECFVEAELDLSVVEDAAVTTLVVEVSCGVAVLGEYSLLC